MPRKAESAPEKSCERCGKPMQRHRYNGRLEDMTRFKARRFCSLRCANSHGTWGQSSTAQHRVSARYRKPHCESCGGTAPRGQMHVHHINKDWRDHRPENLQTLCVGCHLGAHNRRGPNPCLVCPTPARKLGMCQKHYQRWKLYGDPLLTKVRTPGKPSGFSLVRMSS